MMVPAFAGQFAYALVALDMDEDGDADVFAMHVDQLDVRVFRNDGDLSFARMADLAIPAAMGNPGRSSAADLNGDGLVDLVVPCRGIGVRSGIAVFLNRPGGDPTFDAAAYADVDLPDNRHYESVFIVDWDGDGDGDVVTTRSGLDAFSPYFLLTNDGSGAFSVHTLFAGPAAAAAWWGDLDSDGDIDVILSVGNTLYAYTNLGGPTPSFTGPVNIGSSGHVLGTELGLPMFSPHSAFDTLADFDGDGIVDVPHSCGIRFGDGAGGLHPYVRRFGDAGYAGGCVEGRQRMLFYGDYDGDGDVDVVLHHRQSPAGIVLILNNGTGYFPDYLHISNTVFDVSIRVPLFANLDDDDDLEFASIQGTSDAFQPFATLIDARDGTYRTYCLGATCTSVACLAAAVDGYPLHGATRYELAAPTVTGCSGEPYTPPITAHPITIAPDTAATASVSIDCDARGVFLNVDAGRRVVLDHVRVCNTTASSGVAPQPGITVTGADSELTLVNASVVGGTTMLNHLGSPLTRTSVAGGCIQVAGSGRLVLVDSVVEQCTASGPGGGIAVFDAGVVNVGGASVFRANAAPHGAGGHVSVHVTVGGGGVVRIRPGTVLQDGVAVYGGALAAGADSTVLPSNADAATVGAETSDEAVLAASAAAVLVVDAGVTMVRNSAAHGSTFYVCSAPVALDPETAAATSPTISVFFCPAADAGAVPVATAKGASAAPWMGDTLPPFVELGSPPTSASVAGGTVLARRPAGALLTEAVVTYRNMFGGTVGVGASTATLRAVDGNLVLASGEPVRAVGDDGVVSFATEVVLGGSVAALGTPHELEIVLNNGGNVAVSLTVTVDGCDPGSGAASLQPFVCNVCRIGLYAAGGTAACSPIPVCPSGTARAAQTTALLPPCTCLPGHWSPTLEPDVACVPCPAGGLCVGSSTQYPVAVDGYYDISNTTGRGGVDIVKCMRPHSCSAASTCRRGYEGFACTSCAAAFYSDDNGECMACPNAAPTLLVLLLVLVATAIVVAIVFAARAASKVQRALQSAASLARTTSVTHAVSAGILYGQVLALISKTKVEWPSVLEGLMRSTRAFNLSLDLFAVECSLGSYAAKYRVAIVLPAVFVAIVAGASYLASHLRAGMFTFQRVIFTLGPVAYIALAHATLGLFDCIPIRNGEYRLESDLTVVCYDAAWLALLPFGLVGAVYVIGLPMYVFVSLWRVRSTLADPVVQARCGNLYGPYKPSFFLFELLLLGKRLIIVLAALFFSNYLEWLFLTLILIFSGSAVLQLRYAPYHVRAYNTLELHLNLILCSIIGVACAVWADDFSGETSRALFGAFGITAIGLGFVLIARLGLREVQWWCARRGGAVAGGSDDPADAKSDEIIMATYVVPPLPAIVTRRAIAQPSCGAGADARAAPVAASTSESESGGWESATSDLSEYTSTD